jgi:type IV secretory pathway VirB3-like protein
MLVAPVYRAILFPTTIFGIPEKLFMLIAIISMAIIMGLRQYWFIPVPIVIFLIIKPMTKNDPFFFDIFLSSMRIPEVLL